MMSIVATPRHFSVLLILVTLGTVGTALISQFFFGFDPCVLCVYQRIPYGVLAILGVYALLMAGRGPVHGIALLAALSFAVGAGIAFYHVGVEQQWWLSAAPCGGGLDTSASNSDFLAALQQKPEKSCGDIDWTLFGISMATYNFVLSTVMAVLCLAVWPCLKRSEKA
jgi:disulfide bond formation protein DsbB